MPFLSQSFLINTTTSSDQTAPAVAVLRDGRLVVSWTDDSNLNTDWTIGRDVRARVIDANGPGNTLDFKVNTESPTIAVFPNRAQHTPDVVALPNGGFAIAFTDTRTTNDVMIAPTTTLQRFNASGATVGTEQFLFPASLAPNENAIRPGPVSLVALDNGAMAFTGVTSISGILPFDEGRKILMNTVDANGTLGTLFSGAGEWAGFQENPQLARLGNGNIAVAYLSNEGQPSHEYDLRIQIRNPAGVALGQEIRVETPTPFSSSVSGPPYSIAGLANGRFVVTWHQPITNEQRLAGETQEIFARIYSSNGTPVGGLIAVTPPDSLTQLRPIVAAQPDGSFLIVWEQDAGSSSGNFIRGRLYNADGTPNGEAFVLGAAEFGAHKDVDITVTNDGRYLVVWSDLSYLPGEPDQNDAAIRGQYVDPRTAAVNWSGRTISEQFVGTDFADTLDGGRGNDTVWGGAGDDVFVFSTERDMFHGGLGNDTFHVSGNDRVFEAAGEGSADRVIAYANFTLEAGQSIEILEAAAGTAPLTLRGNAFANQIIGNGGANLLIGGGGNDSLSGGNGNDTLAGGAGRDTLTGGLGADHFALVRGGPNADRITDFTDGQDRLQLSAAEFGAGLAPGALAAGAFIANTSGQAQAGSHRFIYETDTGRLYFDADGNGAGTRMLIATLEGLPTLAAGDFLLI